VPGDPLIEERDGQGVTDLVEPGSHGGDGDRLALALGVEPDDVLDLSASLNPAAPDVAVLAARHLASLRRYPRPDAAEAALAERVGVERDRLVLTNGGAEAIALVASEHPSGWAEQFDFSLYRRHLTALDPSGLRWQSDPHNPTGRLRSADDRCDVRDEAFYAIATGAWTRGDPTAIVVGSLTKLFACPGLRLGYVIARDGEEADRLRARRPVWSVNALAVAITEDLLGLADLVRWRDEIASLRAELVATLARHELRCEPSDANYVWVPHARDLRARLTRQGVLVRSGASFGFPDAVRIAVPSAAAFGRFQLALDRSAP
jgi:histidinol-phosphate/aromatic aminotransferase/cobyric acid decarboxylase-like protein